MPKELVEQLEPLKLFVISWRLRSLGLKELKQMILIATLAEELKSKYEIIISSLDKDLMQLVKTEVYP
ncbi:MAG: hypothetical protein Ct9H90mP7_5680 [Candidatus Neomarinimicrobiota bacterium]|nr:MAG: hypothetical protein Ct9H90mP7_5680 [Candidatus Neomarinimicrobiota bacterium]